VYSSVVTLDLSARVVELHAVKFSKTVTPKQQQQQQQQEKARTEESYKKTLLFYLDYIISSDVILCILCMHDFPVC